MFRRYAHAVRRFLKTGRFFLDEVYDVVDEQGRPIGRATWTDCHTKGLKHLCASALVFKDASKQEVLIHKRSSTMAQDPGKWQYSAGGHVLAGDTPEETVQKELQEELLSNRPLPVLVIRKVVRFNNRDLLNNDELLTLYEVVFPGPFSHNPKEVAEPPKWVQWNELMRDMAENPGRYTQAFHNIIKAYRGTTGK